MNQFQISIDFIFAQRQILQRFYEKGKDVVR